MVVRRGLRGAMGENGWLFFEHLKPRAEGSETEILTKCTFWNPINRLACMRKPQTINTLTVRVIGINRAHGGWQRRYSMALHREENKVPLYAVAEVQMENPCPRSYLGPEKSQQKGSMATSWRQRNPRSRWRVRQYKLTTWVRQGRRRAISQWIGVIL